MIVAAGAPAAQEDFVRVEPEAVGLSNDRLAVLTERMQAYVDEGALPGASALILRREQIPRFETFGSADLEGRRPVAEDTVFRVASQTKAVVSVAAMMLQEEGKLLIGDSVGKHLPEFAETTVAVPTEHGAYGVVPASRPITIRDLLTHTSGIGYGHGVARDAWREAGLGGW